MKISNKKLFWSSFGVCIFLLLAAFVPISYESGFNYTIVDTLLGIVIFHNIFVLSALVLLIAIAFAASLSLKN